MVEGMSRLRRLIEHIEGVGTDWANRVHDRGPALMPAMWAVFFVVLFTVGGWRGHPHGLTFPQSLAVGLVVFLAFYAEVRARMDASSWYGRKVRALQDWKNARPRQARMLGAVLIVTTLCATAVTVILVL